MGSYFKSSWSWLIDKRNWKFVKSDECSIPCEIEIPFWFWTYGGYKEHYEPMYSITKDRSIFKKVDSVCLNGLEVVYNVGFKHARITYKDTQLKEFRMFDLDAYPRQASLYSNGMKADVLSEVEYTLITNHGVQHHTSVINNSLSIGTVPFLTLYDLDSSSIRDVGNNKMSYGIAHTPYRVLYRGRTLSKQYLALVSGTWAVLLNDDMSFNSLVFLKGVSDGELVVERFFHTVDTYIVKMMTLTK